MTLLERTDGMSSDEDADVLSNERRREALAVLREAGGPLALADLARDLVEPDTPATAAEAIERRYIRLYHCDVPKLVDAGVVEFDAGHRVVELAD